MNVRFDIAFAGSTDVGLRRSHNQDSHVVLPAADAEQWQQRGHVFLVADGMGAHAVGELASKLAVDSIPHIYSKHAQEGPVSALRRAFVESNLNIHNRGQANKEFEGMGTTASALVLRPEGAWVGHVGDSRVYRVRDGVIEQLSFDHSLVWELARRQKKNPDELEGVPSNVIIRSLGPEALVQVDVEGPHPLEVGDVFVVCSDGLSGPVDDRLIGAIASSVKPDEASRLLVHLANLHGGPDNITAVVVRVEKATETEDLPKPRRSRMLALTRFAQRCRESIWSWLHWPIISLVVGIMLGYVAIYANQLNTGHEIIFFLLAAVFLCVGLLGLFLNTSREVRRPLVTEPEERPLRVYRHVDCEIDETMVQQQCRTLATLEHRLRENDWDLDWNAYRKFLDKGSDAMEKSKFSVAYREHCHAMLLLMEVLAEHRHREEAFKPLW